LFELTAFFGKGSRRKNKNGKSVSFLDCSSHIQDRILSMMPLFYENMLLGRDWGVRVRVPIMPHPGVRDNKNKAPGCQVERQLSHKYIIDSVEGH